jgi:hypothetical protein
MKCLVLFICLVCVLELVNLIDLLAFHFIHIFTKKFPMKLQVDSGGYFYPKNKITKIKIVGGKLYLVFDLKNLVKTMVQVKHGGIG